MLLLINRVSKEDDWWSPFVASSYHFIVSNLSLYVRSGQHIVLCLLYQFACEIFSGSINVMQPVASRLKSLINSGIVHACGKRVLPIGDSYF